MCVCLVRWLTHSVCKSVRLCLWLPIRAHIRTQRLYRCGFYSNISRSNSNTTDHILNLYATPFCFIRSVFLFIILIFTADEPSFTYMRILAGLLVCEWHTNCIHTAHTMTINCFVWLFIYFFVFFFSFCIFSFPFNVSNSQLNHYQRRDIFHAFYFISHFSQISQSQNEWSYFRCEYFYATKYRPNFHRHTVFTQ